MKARTYRRKGNPVASAVKDEFMERWAVAFLCFVVVCVLTDRITFALH